MSSAAFPSALAPLNILIADDHPLIRKIVRATLKREPRFNVVGEAENGLEAVQKSEELRPDVLLLDITMPVLNGFEAARRLRERLPELRIIILSADADQRFIDEAKKIGVRAYVPKSEASLSLVKAIEAAMKTDQFFVVG